MRRPWLLAVAAASLAGLAALAALARHGQSPAGAESRSGTDSGVTPAIAPEEGDAFVDITATAGIASRHAVVDGAMDTIVEAVGAGASWIDADGDGRLDLFLVGQGWHERVSSGERPATPARHALWRNRGDGTFEDITRRAGLHEAGFGFSAAVADYDNDGDQDLYVLNLGPNRLYRNRGDGTFEDVTESAGVGDARCSVAGTFLDADGDGLLDLYVGNYLSFDPAYRLHYEPDVFPGPLAFAAEDDTLYRNMGDGTFRDVSAASGITAPEGRAMGVVATDFDGDGSTDIFVANDASANFLYLNDGRGRFTESALLRGVAYGEDGEATAAMAGSVGDPDGDGLPDLHVTDATYGSLYRNEGGGRFRDDIVRSGVAMLSAQWVSWGGGFLDYDNDGHDDLFLADGDLHHPTGRPDLLLRGRGDGTFEEAPGAGACFAAELCSRGAAFGDIDDDGVLDIVVTSIGDRPVLLHGTARPGRHAILVALEGRRGNRDGLGARVTVEAGGRSRVQVAHARSGYLGQGDPRLHFGLSTATRVDRLEVRWPSGAVQELRDLDVDRVHRIVEDVAP